MRTAIAKADQTVRNVEWFETRSIRGTREFTDATCNCGTCSTLRSPRAALDEDRTGW